MRVGIRVWGRAADALHGFVSQGQEPAALLGEADCILSVSPLDRRQIQKSLDSLLVLDPRVLWGDFRLAGLARSLVWYSTRLWDYEDVERLSVPYRPRAKGLLW